MSNLSLVEIRRIEKQYPDGIGSSQVVEIFKGKGHRFSEATLRKYVQLGLLPKSRRVGVRGRHRGSSGLYPVSIVKLISDIKLALDNGATLEQVRVGNVGLGSELSVLSKCWNEVRGRFTEAIEKSSDDKRKPSLGKTLEQYDKAFEKHVTELTRFAGRIAGEGAEEREAESRQ